MAQRFIDALKANHNQSSSNDKRRKKILERLKQDSPSIRAGALIHDVMHTPYAHTLEDENNLFPKGDKSRRINIMINKIKEELNKLKLSQSVYEGLASYRIFSFRKPEDLSGALDICITLLEEVRKILWTIALHDEIEEKIKAEKVLETPYNKIFEKVRQNVRKEYEKRGINVGILEAEKYYIADIIGNAISADLLSYTLRDSEFTGIETKPGGWYRLFDYLEIAKDDIGRNRLVVRLTKNGIWRQDCFSTIIRILNVRYDLTEQVIYHHAKLSASAMLGKVVQLCGLSENEELYEVGDEGFLEILKNRIMNIKNGKIEGYTQEDVEGAEKLLDSLKCRRLHKRFHMISREKSPLGIDLAEKYSEPNQRRELEKEIESKLGLKPGSVIIFCPKKKGSLKEAETLVMYEKIMEDGSLKSVISPLNSEQTKNFLKEEIGESTAKKVDNVEAQYIDLWRLYVFVDPVIIPIYGYEIKKILNERLGHSTIFDLSYLELTEEYKLSKKISKTMDEMKIPELDKGKVLKRIPAVIQKSQRDGRVEMNLAGIEENLKSIIQTAKDLQTKLDYK
jgi:HD superfamily phosphohydrolase